MQQYNTIYSDKNGRVETSIHNSFSENGANCLRMEIDGLQFKGSSFDDFELVKSQNYSEQQLKRFTFNKVPIFQSEEFAWELCNCNIEVHIPQLIVDNQKEIEIEANLRMLLALGKPMSNGGLNKLIANFKLKINKVQFTSTSDYFENAFLQLQKEMAPKFSFKNCFSCHYSDFSPMGNGFFGSLMCFREKKAEYLTSSSKEDFFKLAGQGFITVQETYNCPQFAHREKDTGYRGWPFELSSK